MKKLLLLILLAIAGGPHARAASYGGQLFQSVVCSQAEYAPGAVATCTLTLQNTTATAYSGSLDVLLWSGRGLQVGATSNVAVGLAAGAGTTATITLTLPAIVEPRGYLISVRDHTSGAVLGSGYVECAPSYLSFPRIGYVGNAAANTNPSAQVADWLTWGVNLPIYYDVYYEAHVPAPPASAPTWTNLENQTLTRTTINSFIAGAHGVGMGIGMLEDWVAANDNWSTDGSGVLPAWGLYGGPCGLTNSCTIWDGVTTSAQQFAIGDTPPDWRSFGWKTNNQPSFDPSNGAWLAYWVRQMRALYSQFAYDIAWVDTIGDVGPAVYRANGEQINAGSGLGPSLADFVNGAIAGTGHPAFINNVDRWADLDVGSRASEPLIYSEIWSSILGGANGTPFYSSIDAGVARYRQVSDKPIVLPAYVNEARRNSTPCIGAGLSTTCQVNPPTALYLTDQILASGAYHAWLVDIDTMTSGPYFVQQQLGMPAALQAGELARQAFGIGYENVLRDGANASPTPCTISGGPTASTSAFGGAVYTLPKQKLGMSICHLLNYSTLTTNTQWSDENAVFTAPTIYSNATVKIYYTGTLSRLWWASPDTKSGEPTVVASGSYTLGTDGAGTFATFTLPSLNYWTMVVAENAALSGVSFDFDPSQPVNGSQANHSCGPVSVSADMLTMQSLSCAEYDGAIFPTNGYPFVNVTYTAVADTQLYVRVDSPTGPLLSNVTLAATTGSAATVKVPATPAGGRHRLYLVAPSRQASVTSFFFSAS